MSDPRAFEVVPQAIVKEIPVDPSLTIQSQNLRKEVVKSIDKGNWRKGLDQVRETQEVKYEGFAKQTSTFGVEIEDNPRSPDYGKVRRTHEEDDYIQRVQQFQELATRFFDKGYDQLATGEKAELRRHVLTQARRVPLLAPQIDRLVAAGQGDNFAERYIKDPSFTAELKNIINNTLDENFDNDVLEKYEDFIEARNGDELLDAELKALQAKLDLANSKLKGFARNATGSPDMGANNAQRIDELKAGADGRRQQILDLDEQLIAATSDVEKYQTRQSTALTGGAGINPALFMKEDPGLKPLKTNRGTLEANAITYRSVMDREAKKNADGTLDIEATDAQQNETWKNAKRALTKAEADIETTRLKIQEIQEEQQLTQGGMMQFQGGNLETIGGELERARARAVEVRQNLARFKGEETELKALEAEEVQIQDSVSNLERDKREIVGRKQTEELKKHRAQREYDAAKEKRLLDEKVYTEKIESSWGRASNEIIAQQLEQANQVFNEELEDMKKASADAHERALYVTMQNTWLGPERRRTKGFPGHKRVDVYRPLDKASILQDYATLLREGDVQLTRCLLERTINPDTNLPFTKDEIDDVFEKNPDLPKKAQPEAVKQLLARKISVGGMTHEDAYIVATSPWGKDMIQNAIDQNTHFRSEISRLMGADALLSHGFKEKFGQEMAKHPFWWSILLGIPAGIKAMQMDPTLENLNNQR